MNIHHHMGAYMTAEQAKALGHSLGSGKGTKPPRTRPGQKYPGGKALRRALANRTQRIEGKQRGRRPDRILSREDETPWGSYGFTKPGSMRG